MTFFRFFLNALTFVGLSCSPSHALGTNDEAQCCGHPGKNAIVSRPAQDRSCIFLFDV